MVHSKSRLAYHPNFVAHTEIIKKFEFENSSIKSLKLKAKHQLITDSYLDNTSRPGSRLDGYSIFHLGLNLELKIFKKSSLDLWVDVQNLFNADYSSHGWISRFGYDGDLDIASNPYLGKEEAEIFHYKALFPQAFRHFNTGLSMRF
ncbi:MAG: hypothetical protein IPM92_07520 [Saprospiraceae bacterium]|nr:hypothetical protein [Saprospiraceae bacterium]